ncbi:3-phenylpropionic acid transporter [Klebsiella pneumoniae]|uniref:3-phenylpropionic acid transporter n=1 Tax=Klebsiella pneumoniae TaxID=573 RepID=A0A447RNQ5_KLEPN|nr:3-phenylpropionic acid transporter [Klebsiella pneumoniae]
MVLHSTRWLALSYFTYFFSYGIFLPFWERLAGRKRADSGNHRHFCLAPVWWPVFSAVC